MLCPWKGEVVWPIQPLPRRRVFVSYRDPQDAGYYSLFSRFFDNTFEFISDRSLDRLFGDKESAPSYVMRMIREKHIKGTSCTIVMCGASTWQRKYVDWEICATLNQKGGLLGICLPTALLQLDGTRRVPRRFFDNWRTGYAVWHHWSELTARPVVLNTWIEDALGRSKTRIDNSQPTLRRNLSIFGR